MVCALGAGGAFAVLGMAGELVCACTSFMLRADTERSLTTLPFSKLGWARDGMSSWMDATIETYLL